MCQSLYINAPNELTTDCLLRQLQVARWLADLPVELKDWVVAQISLHVFREYEMQAEHTHGKDAANAPCFSEYRYVLTQLLSDDDEMFYEAPVFAESLTSWRLMDDRWLVRHPGGLDHRHCLCTERQTKRLDAGLGQHRHDLVTASGGEFNFRIDRAFLEFADLAFEHSSCTDSHFEFSSVMLKALFFRDRAMVRETARSSQAQRPKNFEGMTPR